MYIYIYAYMYVCDIILFIFMQIYTNNTNYTNILTVQQFILQ